MLTTKRFFKGSLKIFVSWHERLRELNLRNRNTVKFGDSCYPSNQLSSQTLSVPQNCYSSSSHVHLVVCCPTPGIISLSLGQARTFELRRNWPQAGDVFLSGRESQRTLYVLFAMQAIAAIACIVPLRLVMLRKHGQILQAGETEVQKLRLLGLHPEICF